MSMYIITHKPVTAPREKGYRLIQAGSFKGRIPGMIHDDIGENISDKNEYYCELTALYWIWKNAPDKYIGINHYRRLFSNKWSREKILSKKAALRLLKRYVIILPQIAFLKQSVRDEYCEHDGFAEDLEKLRKVIEKRTPEYLADFDRYFRGKRTCYLNMMICRRAVFDAYCSWVFPILEELENDIDMSLRTGNQRRIYGYLSERLLNVWVLHNRLRAGHVFITERERELSPVMQTVYSAARTGVYALELLRGYTGKPSGWNGESSRNESTNRREADYTGHHSVHVFTATSRELKDIPDYCVPVEAGSALKKEGEHAAGCRRDDMGENISEKNPCYCELTVLYHAWKNDGAPFKGLCHYRRYFTGNDKPRLYPIGLIKNAQLVKAAPSEQEIVKIFDHFDIILPMPYAPCPLTVREDLEKYVYKKDINILGELLSEPGQEAYAQVWHELQNQKFISYFNMMIAPAEIFDRYCTWLFGLLSDAEKRIDVSEYDAQHKRVFGYLAEVLLNVWVEAEGLKVKYLNVDQILEYSGKTAAEKAGNRAYALIQRFSDRQPGKMLYGWYCRKRYPELYDHCVKRG